MLALIRKYLISGLLVWLPIVVTVLIFRFLIEMLDSTVNLLPPHLRPEAILGFNMPGAGVVLVFIVIVLTGMFAANFLGRRLVDLGDRIVAKIPLVRSVYVGAKQVTQQIFTPGGQSFRKVLLVQYPNLETWSLAFLTSDASEEVVEKLGGEPMVTFFIPTTPNPTSGFLMMRPKSEIIELDMSVDQALKYIISLGVVQPKTFKNKQENK